MISISRKFGALHNLVEHIMRGVPCNEQIRSFVYVFKRNLDYDGRVIAIIRILGIFRKRSMDKNGDFVTQVMP